MHLVGFLPLAATPAYTADMLTRAETSVIDWTDCSLVEVVPGKVSGVPILKHTRVQADSIVENFESGSPVDEISENFSIPEDIIRGVLDYAAAQKQPQQ